ncbi:MAG: hypothetical protein ACKPKO_64735 [Candidatus Fonsibacter sp.]
MSKRSLENTPPSIKLAKSKFIYENTYTNSCIAYSANSPSNIVLQCNFENTPPSIKLEKNR